MLVIGGMLDRPVIVRGMLVVVVVVRTAREVAWMTAMTSVPGAGVLVMGMLDQPVAMTQSVAETMRGRVRDQDQPILANHAELGTVRPAEDGRGEDLVGIALGNDRAVHADDPWQVRGDRVELMGREDDGDAVGVQVGQQMKDVVAGLDRKSVV